MQSSLGRADINVLDDAIRREWLITNGIGGFACGTVSEVNTRRYHGLLIAALAPPVERTLLIASLTTVARYGEERYRLFAHESADGTIDPHGHLQIESFHLDRGTPVWRYAIADAVLEKRLLMAPGKNTTYVNFRVLRASAELDLEWMPLCTWRDYHSHSRGGWDMNVREIQNGFEVEAFPGARLFRISCAGTNFVPDPAWYWNFRHREESARGLDDTEDLFSPGRFIRRLIQGEQATFVLSAESAPAKDIKTVQAQLRKQQSAQLDQLPVDTPDWIRQLVLAAGQFIVERHQADHPMGKTIIAGYPWFSDWGRDTMIALPGLTLATRRFDVAASILRTFATHISEGMLPNRFPDNAEPPEYNTVDATLWYFQAVDQYTQYSGDPALATELFPVLADIIDWHGRGTRYSIKVDPQDGLLTSGEAGVQLTWMDAKVGDWVVTPRIGKAVEVNALWYNALCIMAALAAHLGRQAQATQYQRDAVRVKAGFQRFWNATRQCLYDVIDGPEGEPDVDGRNYDDRLRPNQLFAVSLPYSSLDPQQQKAVLDLCACRLLTSHGLRSLAPGEQGYTGHYGGNARERDGAYHQGTVWAWLIGPFAEAHYRVCRDALVARSFLEPLGLHLNATCLGSVSEIFDADPPHTARGCFAQAWSVAEMLRVWLYLQDKTTTRVPNNHKARSHVKKNP